MLLSASVEPAESRAATAPYSVGIHHVEFIDTADGPRTLAVNIFYPAAKPDSTAKPYALPYATRLVFFEGIEPAAATTPFPLVVFSHGRGSNGMLYAWFAQFLAARGFVVAALDHYRANTYDRTIAYLANRIWQRPRDISLTISHLAASERWGRYIDTTRIGVAGHSQGGFTALWVAGASVDPERFLAFQRRWRNDPQVPRYLRDEMPVDAAPALDVTDPRVRAAFAMAPGIIQAFGMNSQTLARMRVPAYIAVGAGDTVTPPAENAMFAARHIPNARLHVIPGRVGHEIFTNECDAEGKREFPETCIDAAGVDRRKIHARVGAEAVEFFTESFARSIAK